MKIALVSPYDFAYPGGVTAHIQQLAEHFIGAGHLAKILAPCSGEPEPINGVEVLRCGRPVPVPTAGSVARISLSVWQERRIKSLLRNEAFDVVHIHEPFAAVVPLVAAHVSHSLTVGTFHAFSERTRLYRVGKYVLGRTARRLDGRIAVSQAALGYVRRHFPGDYTVIPNGIDVDRFAAPVPPPPEFQDGARHIVFVGRMEKRKGLRYLLAAYSELKWDYPDLRLIVVGPGEPDTDSQRIMAERSLTDVVFAGRVSAEALPGYYQAADIFCTPATGRESFGIVLLEAMAAGTPIVASDIAGYSGVVTHGREGLLTPPRDEKALAGAIRVLLDDPAERRRMGETGRAEVEAYRWERVAGRVLDFYREVGARRREPVGVA